MLTTRLRQRAAVEITMIAIQPRRTTIFKRRRYRLVRHTSARVPPRRELKQKLTRIAGFSLYGDAAADAIMSARARALGVSLILSCRRRQDAGVYDEERHYRPPEYRLMRDIAAERAAEPIKMAEMRRPNT